MRPELPVVLAAVLWGLYWMPLRWLEALGVPDTAAALLMHGVAALAVLPAAWWHRRTLCEDPAGYALVGALVGLAFGGYSAAVSLTTIVNAVLLFYLTPIWIIAIEMVFLGARLSPVRLVGVVLGMAGLVVVLGGGEGAAGWLPLPSNAGDWLGLLAGLAWGVAMVVLHHRSRRLAVAPTTLASLIAAGFAAAAVHLVLAAGPMVPPVAGADPLALAAAVATCLAFVLPAIHLSIRGSQHLAPVALTLILMLEVAIGVVSAALFAGEAFGPRQALGALMVLAAAVTEPLAEATRNRRTVGSRAGDGS